MTISATNPISLSEIEGIEGQGFTKIGASIAVGAVVEARWGAVTDAIDGNPQVLGDFVIGVIAGGLTEIGVKSLTGDSRPPLNRLLKTPPRALSKGSRSPAWSPLPSWHQ